MDSPQLVQRLVESFTALADEVQNLTDRKTILEHKLRFAHEQYQALADKYAPCAPDVAETIAKLQIPPTPTSTNFVPLPSRLHSDSSQAQLALFIREGRKVAQQLATLADATKTSGSTRDTVSTKMTSDLGTVLEKDFTVEGRKGNLQCPFSAIQEHDGGGHVDDDGAPNHIPHPVGDPICAALLEDTASAPTTSGAAQCPIRFMDKHSPEEIARYVETHKHELPRSHEVCLRRNQKNEEQIRKLDAKYGNLVSMIQDLSHLHAPMLPEAEFNQEGHPDQESDRRVSDWAQIVSATVTGDHTADEDAGHDETTLSDLDHDRTGRFDRPLKEVRVGESPSRPWGISVPFPPDEPLLARPVSPAAPVRMPPATPVQPSETPAAKPSKCPFDHSKMRLDDQVQAPVPAPTSAHIPDHEMPAARPSKCPFDFTKMRLNGPGLADFPKMEVEPQSPPSTGPRNTINAAKQPHPLPLKQPQPAPLDSPPQSHQPAFINVPNAAPKAGAAGNTVPQMVFNGPVFIGYPMEQAIQFLQHFQSQQQP